MQMSPYLIFNGTCAEAFPFYERVLGGRIVMMHCTGDDSATRSAGAKSQGKVVHARLQLGDCSLLGSDAADGDEPAGGRTVYVAISVPAAEAERIFKALADRGQVTMPFENTFWSPGFGMLIDRFGTPWMVNTDPGG